MEYFYLCSLQKKNLLFAVFHKYSLSFDNNKQEDLGYIKITS